MSVQETKPSEPSSHKGASKEFSWKRTDREESRYSVESDWLIVKKNDKPIAEIFYTYYRSLQKENRPITFVFNGGPGAASAYLHLGTVGPLRVELQPNGDLLPPPARLIDNNETWLNFTDVVFVDPVGTGFSRPILENKEKAAAETKKENPEDENKAFFEVKKDLETLADFIQQFLSKQNRWSSPVVIAGESYGGFRAAKLAKSLQQGRGVGLSGVILISPAIEFTHLWSSDYDLLQWIEVFPSLAATAAFHKRARGESEDFSKTLLRAEEFAVGKLAHWLLLGDSLSASERVSSTDEMSDLLGLDKKFLERHLGRVPAHVFVRELLRDERKVCGLYDATLTATDPFPDREPFQGADPTLYSIERVFSGAINTQLRERIGVQTDREYFLLNEEVFSSWKVPGSLKDFFEKHLSAADDLRYAMALNPHMQVFITHGYYDLVTPYYASQRIVNHMRLDGAQRERLTFKNFGGGHMFYLWESSRVAFTKAIAEFFAGV